MRTLVLPLWAWVLLAANGATLWALAAPWLPSQDLGAHAELFQVHAHFDSETLQGRVFRRVPLALAGSLGFRLAALLGESFTGLDVVRVMLGFYGLALPWSVAVVSRALGASPWSAVVAAPLVFAGSFHAGFLNFMVALPFVTLSIAAARFWSVRSTGVGAVAWLLCVVLAYMSHILGYMAAMTASLGLFMWPQTPKRTWQATARCFAPWALALGLVALWLHAGHLLHHQFQAGQISWLDGMAFAPLRDRLREWHPWGFRLLRGSSVDEWVAAIFAVAVGCGLVSHILGALTSERGPRRIVAAIASPPFVLSAGAALAFFVLPVHWGRNTNIADRMLIFALLSATQWIPRDRSPALSRRWFAALRTVSLTFVAASATLYPLAVGVAFRNFSATAIDRLPELLQQLPKQSALAVVYRAPWCEHFYGGATWHIPKAIHATANQGVTNDSFAVFPYYPIQYRFNKTQRAFSAQPWRERSLRSFDALLLRTRGVPHDALRQKRLRLLGHDASWWLFAVNKSP